jgi:alpha-L-fucosidase 2
MKLVRVPAVTFVLAFAQLLCADPGPMVLFYDTAATYTSNATSNEAIPIGNGKLAAMIYGGVKTETIQFNEDTVWSGSPDDYAHPGAADVLESIRQQVWAGKGQAAYAIADDTFMSVPLRQSPYEPTAELHLTFEHSQGLSYRRDRLGQLQGRGGDILPGLLRQFPGPRDRDSPDRQ